MRLILTCLKGIPLIRPGDKLAQIIFSAAESSGVSIHSGDVIAVTQKIISKAENRFVSLKNITPSFEAKRLAEITEKDPRFVELVLSESKRVVRAKKGTLIVEHRFGFVCANAGIDHSNVGRDPVGVEETYLLLPENPDISAERIRVEIEDITNERVGVVVVDSHGRAWRNGVTGISIGISGVPGIVDMRGRKDLYNHELHITQVAAADEIAAAASLIMGQAAEKRPVVHIRGFPYTLRASNFKELIRPEAEDLFR